MLVAPQLNTQAVTEVLIQRLDGPVEDVTRLTVSTMHVIYNRAVASCRWTIERCHQVVQRPTPD